VTSPITAVIDYGVGNLLSVRRALEHCGATVAVTADPAAILSAKCVVLPGVGAFAKGMSELCRTGLDAVTREVAARGIPLLGICLGMQMLLDESEEFGSNRGLGLIPGRVIALAPTTAEGGLRKIPHIGWNGLLPAGERKNWLGTPLHELQVGDAVYFLHSFMADPAHLEDCVADCLYGGTKVSAAIGRANVFGCQFHPEKSGQIGLKVLKAFVVDACASSQHQAP
jgi:imidazole glycerol-phosphate synthase subunit HisH